MYVNMTYCLPYFVPPCSLSPPLPKAHLLGWIGDAYGPFIPSILLSTLSIRVVLFDPNWVPTYCNQFTVFLLTSWAAWGTLNLRVTPWPLSLSISKTHLLHTQCTLKIWPLSACATISLVQGVITDDGNCHGKPLSTKLLSPPLQSECVPSMHLLKSLHQGDDFRR